MKNFFILALTGLALGGCTTVSNLNPFSSGNPDLKANQELRSKWAGKPADDFFAKLGAPANKITTAGGDLVYIWSKRESVSSTVYFCDLRLVANSRGNLTDIQITGVTAGKKSRNYCDEISW